MLCVRPDFYDEFRCIADKCSHSCCLGWEIDIDPDTAELYSQLPGELGQELRDRICLEPAPHFELTEDERCPFLNKQGLCRLILGYGEDVLCDICREHPRFYNEFDEREEMGLGLCCEEAVRLLLNGEEPLGFICQSDEEWEETVPELISLRDELMHLISNTQLPLEQRIRLCLELLNIREHEYDIVRWREFFLSLERMDESWTKELESLQDWREALPDDMAHTRLFQYLLYRHFAVAEDEREAKCRFLFCLLSLRLIWAMEANGTALKELVRLFSAEIEYSDENIGLILAALEEGRK